MKLRLKVSGNGSHQCFDIQQKKWWGWKTIKTRVLRNVAQRDFDDLIESREFDGQVLREVEIEKNKE